MAIDFKKSGVQKGGLGIYSATKNLQSPASSSLDKPAGTLSKKTTADLAAAGQSAQVLLTNIPRVLKDDYTAAARSYSYMAGLFAIDPLLQAESELITKYTAQATPQQKIELLQESGKQGIGLQRAIAERIAESDQTLSTSQQQINIPTGLLIAAAALFLLGGKKW